MMIRVLRVAALAGGFALVASSCAQVLGDELAAHDALLAKIAKRSGRALDWSAPAATTNQLPPASAAA